uniref:Apical membrane antigen n=1 Tax=Toxoplasma gondii TaxID=5811 RepID=B9VQX5_TOXGO|nr:apical membrane antigen [Toxoplasma gondii]
MQIFAESNVSLLPMNSKQSPKLPQICVLRQPKSSPSTRSGCAELCDPSNKPGHLLPSFISAFAQTRIFARTYHKTTAHPVSCITHLRIS